MTKNHLCLIKIGSEMAEISINITISNTSVPPQILDNLKKPLEKQNSAIYVVFQPMPMLAFFVGIFVLVWYAQPAGPCIVIFN